MIRSNLGLENIDGLSSLETMTEINIWSNPVENFCPLKNLILENPGIKFRIEGINVSRLDRLYFEECE